MSKKSILITILALGLSLSLAHAQPTANYSGRTSGTIPALDVKSQAWWVTQGYSINVKIKPEIGIGDPEFSVVGAPGYLVSWTGCLGPWYAMSCVRVDGWAPANTPGIVQQSADAYRVNLDVDMLSSPKGTPGGKITIYCENPGCAPLTGVTTWPLVGTFWKDKLGDVGDTIRLNGSLSITSKWGVYGVESVSFNGTMTQAPAIFEGKVGDSRMEPTPAGGVGASATFYKGAMTINSVIP